MWDSIAFIKVYFPEREAGSTPASPRVKTGNGTAEPAGEPLLLPPIGGRIPGCAHRHYLRRGNKGPQGLPAQRGGGITFGNIVAPVPHGQQHTGSRSRL